MIIADGRSDGFRTCDCLRAFASSRGPATSLSPGWAPVAHRATGTPPRWAMTYRGSAKKWAGKPARSIGGLNHRKQRARSARTPGGWGAEESGAVADRALRDFRFASYRGAAWAELGPYYEVS